MFFNRRTSNYSVRRKSGPSHYIRMQQHNFESPKKVRSNDPSTLILFLLNPQDSEVFDKWSVLLLQHVQTLRKVGYLQQQFHGIQRQCLPLLNKNSEFREIAAAISQLCAGSRRATIAIQSIFKTSESCGFFKKRIRAIQAVFHTFLGDSKLCHYIRMQ